MELRAEDLDPALKKKVEMMTGIKLHKSGGGGKYKNKPTEIDGMVFDSIAEAKRYMYHKARLQQRQIKGFKCQYPKYIIQEAYKHAITGAQVKAITYTPDFMIENLDGTVTIEDVKGMTAPLTQLFKVKKKIVEYKYEIVVEIIRM